MLAQTEITEKYFLVFLWTISLSTSLFLLYFAWNAGFSRDDFPLLVESFDFIKNFNPMLNSHFRPIIRFHFGLHKLLGLSPFLFYCLNILLHLLSAFALFKILRLSQTLSFSLVSALTFYNLFVYNEVLFWISAIPVEYCMLFCLLSIYYHQKNNCPLTIVFLILAAGSYETWLVLPAYYLFFKRKRILLTGISLIMAIGQWLMIHQSGGSLQDYGGLSKLAKIPSAIVIYLLKTLSPLRNIPSPLTYLVFALFIGFVFYRILKAENSKVLSLVFYFVPALLFLMSLFIPHRFFYFPALAISIWLAQASQVKRMFKWFGRILIVYLMCMSLLLNYLDGMDYLNYSHEHTKVLSKGSKLRSLKTGDRIRLINCESTFIPHRYFNCLRGRKKLLFVRSKGVGALINNPVYVDFILYPLGLKGVPIPHSQDSDPILIGTGYPISEYYFQVIPR